MSDRTWPDPSRLRRGHGAKWTAVNADVIPAWVADMDLGIPEAVRRRITEILAAGDLGYPFWRGEDPAVIAFRDRMRLRYGWQPAEGRTRVMSDLIQVLQVVIEHATEPGDVIAIHVPTYPPFLASIARSNRTILPLPPTRTDGGWSFDPNTHRQLIAEANPRLLVLVNPHNPTGHVLRRDELRGLAEIAVERQIPVLADEIHAELTYRPYEHVPFASLGSEVADLTITTTSATKAFNLAGIRCALAHVGHTPTADALDRAPLDYFGTPSALSRIATVAAWRESDEWHEDLMRLLGANRRRVAEWIDSRPELNAASPEATYLAWIDFSGSAIASDPAGHLLLEARVQLSPGKEFSQQTDVDTTAHARLNFATNTTTLDEILCRLDAAMETTDKN